MPEASTEPQTSPEDGQRQSGAAPHAGEAGPAGLGDWRSPGRLEHSIRRLAAAHSATRRPGDPQAFLNRVADHAAVLRRARDAFAEGAAPDIDDPYVAEWLLDNFYVVQQAVRQIEEDMPPRYYRQLPKLEGWRPGDAGDLPRVYAIALALIEVCDGNLQRSTNLHFLNIYQSETPLTMGEVWALPTMLRVGVMEQIVGALTPPSPPSPAKPGEGGNGAARSDDQPGEGGTGFEAEHSVLETLPAHEVVGNGILSLRMLAAEDWESFFEEVNQVEHILRTDPAGVYASMEFPTRDHYRKVVEELAFRTGISQIEVAREAVRLADKHLRQDGLSVQCEVHVGYYLIDAGRRQLEEQIDFRAGWGERWRRWVLDHPTLVYLGGIFVLSVAILAGLAAYAFGSAAGQARGLPLQLQLAAAVILGVVPAITIAVSVVNWLVTHLLPPDRLPKIDFEAGIPAEHRTMVIVPALLTTPDEIQSLVRQLELHYLSNPDRHLSFALLTDFADAPERTMPEDQALVGAAVEGIRALNARYERDGPAPFYLFHRERLWNPRERVWMGWERKRGKLEEFNRLLLGEQEREATSYVEQIGDLEVLPDVEYVITLDADTTLPRNSARRLVGTLAHPLNRPRFNPESGRVDAGYTVLQPRTEIKPTSATQSWFARIFAGDTALDLYTRAVSDVYQDLFGEGIFVGKGIYDVAAFHRSLAGRVPENALLSHDLFEGIHGRAGLVTDIVLFEDYPPSYLVYTSRLHRWIRGDWQLLPWLLGPVPLADGSAGGSAPRGRNPLSLIDRWKIADNLRRSLVSPVLILLLAAGWFWLPGSAFVWTLVAVLTPAVPLLTGAASELIQRLRERRLTGPAPPLRMQAMRWLLVLVFLPYEALISVDAIGTTLVRLAVTRRRLLQWTTAAHTVRLFGRERQVRLVWQQMRAAPILALALAAGLGILVGLTDIGALVLAGPLLAAWLVSPQIALWISRPVRPPEPRPLTADELRQVRRVARRTWLYFEQFAGPDDNWLPPDHFQESPRGTVAHRTSPTNIGLLLLATLGAYDLGYVGLLGLHARLRSTFETLDALERYRGHFLNWYDTQSLNPLSPRYVSTVDSGNLAACLLALRQACLRIAEDQIPRRERWQGLLDTVDVLDEVLDAAGDAALAEYAPLSEQLEAMRETALAASHAPRLSEESGRAEGSEWPSLLERLDEEMRPELDRRLVAFIQANPHALDAAMVNSLRAWAERIRHQLFAMRRESGTLVPWAAALAQPPALFEADNAPPAVASGWQRLHDTLAASLTLGGIPALCTAAQSELAALRAALGVEANGARRADQVAAADAWCSELAPDLSQAQTEARRLLDGLHDLADRSERYVQEARFDFLFDAHRQLFRIGYDVEAGQLDANYYDLLASEARIASLVAIALGHVPASHWLHLGRPLTQVGAQRVLLSWSGTMFEYLMPPLLLENYVNTLLDQSTHAAVRCQIDYAAQRDAPWGISESGYYAFDADLNYQYRAFGVPGLGFRRGLEDDLVVSPYSSLLAIGLDPDAVMANLRRFRDLGMLRDFGFYEAVDYTAPRLPPRQDRAIIRSFMAHHQGMILLALVNHVRNMRMVRRFHADPRIQSVELLLQEQVPHRAPLEQLPEEEVAPQVSRATETDSRLQSTSQAGETGASGAGPWSVPIHAPFPQAHWLSNGQYSTLVTSAGGGFSRWNDMALTRWRADTTLENWGAWLYLQDLEADALWSLTWQPTGAEARREVVFSPHSAAFQCQAHDIAARMEISVTPQDDVEIRRVRLINDSDRRRRLRLTSYGEVVLAPQDTDQRHPAFNKMFIESEYLAGLSALLFRRRPRSAEDIPYHLVHMVVANTDDLPAPAYETDRARFLGRGGSPRAPAALIPTGRGLAGTTGATLDPIMSLGQVVELEPRASIEVAFITLAGESTEEVRNLAERYRDWSRIERAVDQARAQSEAALRELELSGADLARIQQLLSLLLYPHPALRADPAILAANRRGQPALWSYAISGDYPILLVRVSSEEHAPLVREVLRAHAYWRQRQLKIDLVILNDADTSYDQGVQGRLHRLLDATNSAEWIHRRGGIFLVRSEQISEADEVLLATAARVVLDGDRGSLEEQMRGILEHPTRLPTFTPAAAGEEISAGRGSEPMPSVPRPDGLLFDNGFGGFSPDGQEYVIYLQPGEWTPAPWINVIANPDFGFLVSEAHGGYSWSVNSGENRLTPWYNDPVRDTPGEAIYLRDEETAAAWSPTPLPAADDEPYLVRHGAGYSVFEHHSRGLKQRVRTFAAPDAPLKVVTVRLENVWQHTRRITITYYAEWVLGVNRDTMQQYIIPEYDAEHQALLAYNPYNTEFSDRVAFVASNREPHGLTADRTEFLGRLGSLAQPAALQRIGLANRVEPGLDPCAAIQVHIDLPPGEAQEVAFIIGQGDNREAALELVREFRDPGRIAAAWDGARQAWDDVLGAVEVDTPDSAVNLLLNRWLLYQNIACRIWGRSALYQSSGAYGFRDQLQDVLAVLHSRPDLAREQILRAARHQFEAGDVLHWWHPPSGRGVRTRITDDLLWLPFVTAHYVEVTGDGSILAEEAPFRVGEPLKPDENERYGLYELTQAQYPLYEHCRRAIAAGTTAGPHGLPLIGGGDWNDGMNRVGIDGRGESIWLGWFLHATLTRFAAVAERMQDDATAESYRRQAADLQTALAESGWDGGWYRRAYYDDGTPLGSSQNMECEIDAIAQSWAVLSGAGNEDRAATAMDAVRRRLIRPQDRLLLLFTPPFDDTPRDPGYIKGYPPGVRENGGQYTHAAVWTVWAIAQMGDGDYAGELYRMLNPIYHTDSRSKAERYAVEPYVTAADIYSVPPHTGRGGWTWYTGSGGWLYRLGLEAILGVRRRGDTLQIEPTIPSQWSGYEVAYRYGATTYRIAVCNSAGVTRGVQRVSLDGRELTDGSVPLRDDGREHDVRVEMG